MNGSNQKQKIRVQKPLLPTTLNPTQMHWSANILAQVQALTDNIIGSRRIENRENYASTNAHTQKIPHAFHPNNQCVMTETES